MKPDTVRVLGLPTEGKENFLKGTSLAPAFIRWAFVGVEDASLHRDRVLQPFEDLGDLPFILEETDGRNRLDRMLSHLPEKLAPPFLLLGGDHLVSLAGVERARAMYPDLHVLHLDAHLDARPHYLGDAFSHASVMFQIARLVNHRITSIGIRSRAPEESPSWTVVPAGEDPLPHLQNIQGPVYLTVDMDVFADFPCVSNFEPGGISFQEFLSILEHLPRVVAADLVEYNPLAGPPACAAFAAVVFREILLTLQGQD